MMRSVIRAVLAAAALIALVVGLPVALLAWGRSPLDGNGSTWDQLTAMPTQTVSDTMAFGALTIAAWIGWTIFTAHVVVESAAVAGASMRWRLPAFGPFQLGARRLVTALTMTAALSGPLGQRAGAVPTLPAATSSLELEARVLGPPPRPLPTAAAGAGAVSERQPTTFDNRVDDTDIHIDAAAIADTPTPSSSPPIVTVVAGDHPWGLAERHLGDGLRWHEIWDLNKGAAQPDGRAWVREDLIQPGWQFRLPEDAIALPSESATITEETASPTTSEPGGGQAEDLDSGPSAERPDSSSMTEPDEVEDEAQASSDGASETPTAGDPQLPPEPEDTSDPPVSPSTTEPGDVSSESSGSSSTTEPDDGGNGPPVSSGQGSDVPTAPEDSGRPSADEASPESTTTTTSMPNDASDASSDVTPNNAAHSPDGGEEDDASGGNSIPAAPLLGIAGSLMAVGVARDLRRRRARRSAKLPIGTVPSPPPPLTVAGEVLEADEDAADRLDTAIAHLANNLRPRRGADSVQPRVVQATGGRIDVCLDRADPNPPAPWRPEASGLIWVLDENQALSPLEDPTPLPSLVTVGVGDADVLLDLEAHGVIGLVGDPTMCQRMARSMVAELAVRGEGIVATTLVGDVLGQSEMGFDGVDVASSWSDVDTSAIEGSVRLLDAGQWPHTWAARASGRVFDGWAPSIWVTLPTDDPRCLSAIEAVSTRPGAGSAVVVVGGDPGCGLRIHVDEDGNFRIPDLGLTGAAQLLGSQATGQVIELLDDADTHEGTVIPLAAVYSLDSDGPQLHEDGVLNNEEQSETEPGLATTSTSATLSPLHRDGYHDPGYEVLVRVCGPIQIDGARHNLPQREMAVATYVALRGQADVDQIRNAVWGGTDVSRKRTQNVISTVLKAVGEAITHTATGRLATGAGLVTDLELIERRINYARHQEPQDRLPILREGLDLVTGHVCTFPKSAGRAWKWIELDGWIAHVEAIVGTLAMELATLCIELDDGHGAIDAAQRGIDAVGRRTELAVLLVRGHEQIGDETAARVAVRSHEAYLEDLGIDELDEELLELLDRYAAPKRSKLDS